MSPAERSLRGRYNRNVGHIGSAGSRLLDDVLGRIGQANPQEAHQRAVMGAHNVFKDRFGESLSALRGQQVAGGRINTGFGVGDEDRLFRRLGQDAQNTINQSALASSGQNLSLLSMMGSLGSNLSGTALNAQQGQLNRMEDQRRMDDQARSQGWGSLLSSIIGGAGTIAGMPIGGATVGGALFKRLFG